MRRVQIIKASNSFGDCKCMKFVEEGVGGLERRKWHVREKTKRQFASRELRRQRCERKERKRKVGYARKKMKK